MILGFKDGEDAIPVHLVTDFIFKTIPYAERKDLLFCTIPASTREKPALLRTGMRGHQLEERLFRYHDSV